MEEKWVLESSHGKANKQAHKEEEKGKEQKKA